MKLQKQFATNHSILDVDKKSSVSKIPENKKTEEKPQIKESYSPEANAAIKAAALGGQAYQLSVGSMSQYESLTRKDSNLSGAQILEDGNIGVIISNVKQAAEAAKGDYEYKFDISSVKNDNDNTYSVKKGMKFEEVNKACGDYIVADEDGRFTHYNKNGNAVGRFDMNTKDETETNKQKPFGEKVLNVFTDLFFSIVKNFK